MLAGPIVSLRKEARQYLARGRMVGFFPTLGSTYIFYYLPSRKVEEFRAQEFQSFKSELASIAPEVSDSLGGLGSWDDIAHSSISRVDAENWVADQAALLGDAAYALDPPWLQVAYLFLQAAAALCLAIETL